MNTPMDDDEEFSLVEPFHVDNGELEGLTLQQAFVLGYEYAVIREKLDIGSFPFEVTFHSENEARVRKMLDRNNAHYEIAIHDDWPLLAVFGVSSI